MPANLTPEYQEAERKFRTATTPQERLAALEEMLATIPKHKGTEKMQADIKRRIAKARNETQRKGGAVRQRPHTHVDKEGAGQVVLVGPPNSGKSQLLAALTNAKPEIAPWPFSTRIPLPGMVAFENVQIQLVDLPPIAAESAEPWVLGIIRIADAALLVIDLSDDDLLTALEHTLDLLHRARIDLVSGNAREIAPAPDEVAGDGGRRAVKPTVLVANKLDAPHAAANLEVVQDLYGKRFTILPVSALMETGLEELRAQMFRLLDVIRVYTKAPGKKPNLSTPLIMKRGGTLLDAAREIHKDFAHNLKFARLWRARTYEGLMVPREHVLEDGDVLEFHL